MKTKLLVALLACAPWFAAAAESVQTTLTVIFDNGEVRVLNGAKPKVYRLEKYEAAEVDSINQVVVDDDARLIYVRPVTRFRGRRMDVYRFGDKRRLMALPGVSNVVIPQGGRADVVVAFLFQAPHAKTLREADVLFEDFINDFDYGEFIVQTRRRNAPNLVEWWTGYYEKPYVGDWPRWVWGACYLEKVSGFLDAARSVFSAPNYEKRVRTETKITGLDDSINSVVSSCDGDGNMWIQGDYQNAFIYADTRDKKVHSVKGRDYPAECFAVWSRLTLGCLDWNKKTQDIEYSEHSWRSDEPSMLKHHLDDPERVTDALVVVGRDANADCVYFTELDVGRLNIKWNGPDLFELCLAGKPVIRQVDIGQVGRGQKVVGVYVQ